MRDKYETKADLDREDAIKDLIPRIVMQNIKQAHGAGVERLVGASLVKLPESYRLDWAIISSGTKMCGWGELKCRNVEHNRYPDIMLAAQKVSAGRELSRNTGIPFLFFMGFYDGIGIAVVDDTKAYDIRYAGRTSARRDAEDVEPICMIPLDVFMPFDLKYLFPSVVPTEDQTQERSMIEIYRDKIKGGLKVDCN